ncbi:MAG TPA: hypothetical protein VLW85_05110, partial [Myxococcales bacterium]|nr:hypothetical protein [Myxococcales bacterium]
YEVLAIAEQVRQNAELKRRAAERERLLAAERFEMDTRRAIRQEVEIANEMLRSANALRDLLEPIKPARRR